MVATYLCDYDLYSLTCVSHRMASIACPIYFVRKGLLVSPYNKDLSLRRDGFNAFAVWRRSPAFLAMQRLDCIFSFDLVEAAQQRQHLKEGFDLLPLEPKSAFDHVHFAHIQTQTLEEVLDLVLNAVLLTGCHTVTLSGVTVHTPPPRASGRVHSRRQRSSNDVVYLEFLQKLRLYRFNLSPPQWDSFLSNMIVESLCGLEINGETSMAAVHNFLLQNPDIHELRFISSTWMDIPSSPRQLDLPKLRTLQGSLSQILYLLHSFPSSPYLHTLKIGSSPPAESQPGRFVDQVTDCVAMCDRSLHLEVNISKEQCMAGLELADVRAWAAHKLDSITLPTVTKLRLYFEGNDEVLPVRDYL